MSHDTGTTPLPDTPEENTEPQPRTVRAALVPKLLGTLFFSTAFALVISIIISALQIAGVISMGLAHLLIFLAWIIAVVAVWIWLLSHPVKHATRVGLGIAIGLGVVLFVLDRWMVSKRAEIDRDAVAKQQQQSPGATPPPAAPPTPTTAPQAAPSPHSSDSQQARNEFRNETTRPVRDVAVNVKLNRSYSIQELGHFRIPYVIADNVENIEFYLGCQDLYGTNTVNPSVDPTVESVRLTIYGSIPGAKKNNTYLPIPVYTRSPKYSGVLSASQWTDTLGFSLDLYNQIPSLKTLEDLNRKVLFIYVSESLIDKISEVSFTVNNYELISGKSDGLVFTEDKPSVDWFIPLSKAERAVRWRGVFQKDTEGVAQRLGIREVVVQWSLDFGVINPKRLPEPGTQNK